MKFRGIRVVSVSQGIDTQNDEADVLFTVHGLVDSLYIKELAKKTHRGFEGKAPKGEQTGGRCFGYDNVRTDDDQVRLEINDAEAAVVKRIFEMAANGASLKGITKTFNSEHIPLPGNGRARVMGHGATMRSVKCFGMNCTLDARFGIDPSSLRDRVPTNGFDVNGPSPIG